LFALEFKFGVGQKSCSVFSVPFSSTVLKNSGRLFQLIPNDDYVPIIYEIAKYRFSLCLAEFFLSYL
jgi:hypothetical protein